MFEAFNSLIRAVVDTMAPIVPCPLVVTDARGVVVASSSDALVGET